MKKSKCGITGNKINKGKMMEGSLRNLDNEEKARDEIHGEDDK